MGYKKHAFSNWPYVSPFVALSWLSEWPLGVASLFILPYFAKYLRAIFTILGAQKALSGIRFPTRRADARSIRALMSAQVIASSLLLWSLSSSLPSLLLGCYAIWGSIEPIGVNLYSRI